MKNQGTITELKGQSFDGTYYPKIKRIRQYPRQRIRQLLLSFEPIEIEPKTTN